MENLKFVKCTHKDWEYGMILTDGIMYFWRDTNGDIRALSDWAGHVDKDTGLSEDTHNHWIDDADSTDYKDRKVYFTNELVYIGFASEGQFAVDKCVEFQDNYSARFVRAAHKKHMMEIVDAVYNNTILLSEVDAQMLVDALSKAPNSQLKEQNKRFIDAVQRHKELIKE